MPENVVQNDLKIGQNGITQPENASFDGWIRKAQDVTIYAAR